MVIACPPARVLLLPAVASTSCPSPGTSQPHPASIVPPFAAHPATVAPGHLCWPYPSTSWGFLHNPLHWYMTQRRHARATDKAIPGSGQLSVLNRELANAFASGREQRVTERRYHRWHAWLAHAGRQVVARQEVHMCLIGRLGDPRHRVIVVVGLLDLAIGCRDLAHQGHARGKDRGAFKLRLHALRVNHVAGIDHQVHTRDPHLPLLVDLDVDNCGHIAEKTPMRRKAQCTTR